MKDVPRCLMILEAMALCTYGYIRGQVPMHMVIIWILKSNNSSGKISQEII